MLPLVATTDPGWYERVRPALDALLVDHTHLEKRAASSALAMIFRYTGVPGLARELALVVREEMEHFSRMLALLEERGLQLVKLEPAPYAARLGAKVRKGAEEGLLDKLLVAALIEARSCERFGELERRLDDRALADFYGELRRDEARHYAQYLGLARRQFGAEAVKDRLATLAEAEWQALASSRGAPRLHSF